MTFIEEVRRKQSDIERRIRAVEAITKWSHCSRELRAMVLDEIDCIQVENRELIARLEAWNRRIVEEFSPMEVE